MSTCTSYVHTHAYIEGMCLKEVSKCAITCNEAFLVEIVNSNAEGIIYQGSHRTVRCEFPVFAM